MTPSEFALAYRPQADIVSAGTGIDSLVLLAQWGVETDWGNAINNPNNLGNIRCVLNWPCVAGFAQFPNLTSFCSEAIGTWHNGFYPDVLSAVGAPAQIAAIAASPWDAGHYDSGTGPGSALWAAYFLLTEVDMPYLVRDPATQGIYVVGETGKRLISAVEWSLYGSHGVTFVNSDTATLATIPPVPGSSALTAAQAQELQELHDTVLKDLAR